MKNLYDIFSATTSPFSFKRLVWKEVLIAHYECPSMEKLESVYAHHNSIVMVYSGKKFLYRNHKMYPLTRGTYTFIKRGAYTLEKFFDEPWCAIAMYVPDSYLRQVVDEYRKQTHFHLTTGSSHEQIISLNISDAIRSFYNSFMPYFDLKPPVSETILELKFRELLLTLFSDPDNSEFLDHVARHCHTSKIDLGEVMEQNYMYNLSSREYARIAGRSLAAFKREFQELFKDTPGKWLMKKRLEYAKCLLMTTSKSVGDISFESGFKSSTHFIRAFRETFGASPLQYRKQHSYAPAIAMITHSYNIPDGA